MPQSVPSPSGHLAAVPQGIQVCVSGLAPGGDPLIRRRLFDLGFRKGVEVTPVRTAPLGDPRVYRLHGTDFSLRKPEAVMVLVDSSQPVEPSAPDQIENGIEGGVKE